MDMVYLWGYLSSREEGEVEVSGPMAHGPWPVITRGHCHGLIIPIWGAWTPNNTDFGRFFAPFADNTVSHRC